MYKYFLLLFLLLNLGWVQAQTVLDDDLELAEAYYKNNEFEKAVALFDKVYSKHSNEQTVYQKYLVVLTNLKQYDKAEKIIKKQIKQNPGEPNYTIDLIKLYQTESKHKEAEQTTEQYIKKMLPDENRIRRFAMALADMGDIANAIATFEQGNKIFKDDNFYLMDIAILNGKRGNTKEMFAALVEVADQSATQLQEVKNVLQSYLTNDDASVELQSHIFKKLQRNPDNQPLTDLLIWIFIQRKDFEGALTQVKAIDRRSRGGGATVIEVARAAADEEEYDAAIDGFSYVVSLGKDAPLFYSARAELLKTKKLKLVRGNYTPADVVSLKNDYVQFLNEYRSNVTRVGGTVRELAQLEAKYIYNVDTAIVILENALKLPWQDSRMKNSLKLDLGDYYLINGDKWESTLIYSQVDKEMQAEPLGELARFKNAKWSYYFGDFEWAQGQMDVLKGSTSEEIANDALDLSIFITENLGSSGDSIAHLNAMKLFAAADLLNFQNKNEEAIQAFDSLLHFYPDSDLEDNVLFAKANILEEERKYAAAIPLLENILTKWGDDILADDALFSLADIYQFHQIDLEKAKQLYGDLLLKYPGSTFVVEARKRFRQLRGDKTN